MNSTASSKFPHQDEGFAKIEGLRGRLLEMQEMRDRALVHGCAQDGISPCP